MARKRFHIYVLIDPRDRWPYYVGYTGRPVEKRLEEHCEKSGAYSALTRRNQAIIKTGQRPIMMLVDTASNELEARLFEIYWIVHYMKMGIDLCNRENQQWLYDGLEETVTEIRLEWKATKPKKQGKQPARQGQPWTDAENTKLLALLDNAEAAKALGRSERAVEMQRVKLTQS